MSGSLNKVILIGNVGQDPELRATSDGKEIASFSVATSENWKDKGTGERKERTEWHRIIVFQEGLVQVIKNYVKKGSKIMVEGQLQTRKWQDNSGVDKYTTEIVLQGFQSRLILLDSRAQNAQGYSESNNNLHAGMNSNSNSNGQNGMNFNQNSIDDEIPF